VKHKTPDSTRIEALEHRFELSHLDISTEARSQLAVYLDLLEKWNRRINLTGALNPTERVDILVAKVLPALPFLAPGRVIDVGSGNGSPGIVLALLHSSSQITLLEPRLRRWAFLREVTRTLAMENVDVRRERHEDYAGPPAETVTIRGLVFARGALDPLLIGGGRLLCFGGFREPGDGYRLHAAAGDLHVWVRCFT
jgi:16S rRNA (guanine527-N7)-methyltransferase